MDKNFFILKDNNYFVNVPNLRILIPKQYFDEDYNIAEFVTNDTIKTIGLVFFSISNNYEFSPKEKIYLLHLPTFLELKPASIEEYVVDLNEKTECYVLFYTKDMILCPNEFEQSVDFVERFISKMLHAGKIPSIVGYTNIFNYYIDSIKFHSVNLRIPNLILESIISELARYKKDISKKFRTVIGESNSVKETDFKLFNIKDIPHISSNFSAITFEDMNRALQVSVQRTKTDSDKISSPLEKNII